MQLEHSKVRCTLAFVRIRVFFVKVLLYGPYYTFLMGKEGKIGFSAMLLLFKHSTDASTHTYAYTLTPMNAYTHIRPL